jgi:hypothetical protein
MQITPSFSLQKLTLYVCFCFMLLPVWCSASDVLPIKPNPISSSTRRTYVEFSIVNDLGEDYPFFLGGPNKIEKGTTRTFNYPEDTEIFHLSAESDKGKEWFKVNTDMQRQTYLLSQFIREQP